MQAVVPPTSTPWGKKKPRKTGKKKQPAARSAQLLPEMHQWSALMTAAAARSCVGTKDEKGSWCPRRRSKSVLSRRAARRGNLSQAFFFAEVFFCRARSREGAGATDPASSRAMTRLRFVNEATNISGHTEQDHATERLGKRLASLRVRYVRVPTGGPFGLEDW